jgi:hypothetical protein
MTCSSRLTLHMAEGNYFLPAVFGCGTGGNEDQRLGLRYGAGVRGEEAPREATLAEVRTSFEHVRRAVAGAPESRMNAPVSVFDQNMTMRSFLLLTTTHVHAHLHEHVGQLIVYARSNGVVPPWSR